MRKIAHGAYLVLISFMGALLIELLTENGVNHLAAIRNGAELPGTFADLNDRLYLPAALVSISVISRFVSRKASSDKIILTGVLLVSALVMLFGPSL